MSGLIIPPKASWGLPVKSWDFSVGVTQVDFTDLGAYSELMIWGYGITTNAAGNTALYARLSTDNGATFLNTSYVNGGSSQNDAWNLTPNETGVTRMFQMYIQNFKNNSQQILAWWIAAQEAASNNTSSKTGRRASAGYNALRIVNSTGNNITAGSIRVYGKL